MMSSHYAYKGGQPYMAVEGGPAGFVKWYMRDVSRGSETVASTPPFSRTRAPHGT